MNITNKLGSISIESSNNLMGTQDAESSSISIEASLNREPFKPDPDKNNLPRPSSKNNYRLKTEQDYAAAHDQLKKLKTMLVEMGTQDIEKKMEIISGFSLFRGVTKSNEMSEAFQKMLSGETTRLPVMWGFRAYQPKSALANKELFTLQSIANDIRQMVQAGLKVEAPIILADLHAQHNNVPAVAVPKEQGGVGNEGYEAYYEKIAEEAKKLGIPTVKLSDIFNSLKIVPHEVAKCGASLTRSPDDRGGADRASGILHLTKQDLHTYVKQALHMVERYPTVPVNQAILAASPEKQKEELINKAMAYIHFRQGEGAMLLPRLSEFFKTNVIPVHVSDPNAQSIGVKGLYIFSKSNRGKNVADIPWKGVKDGIKVASGESKFSPQEVEAIKLTQEQLIRKNGYRFSYSAAATRVAVALSKDGYEGDALLEKAKERLDLIATEQKEKSTSKQMNAVEKIAAKTIPKLRQHVNVSQYVAPIKDFHAELASLKERTNQWQKQWENQGQSLKAELKNHPKILKQE